MEGNQEYKIVRHILLLGESGGFLHLLEPKTYFNGMEIAGPILFLEKLHDQQLTDFLH